jgi:site-specific recombinase XerC
MRLLCAAGRVGARQLALGWRQAMEDDGLASGTIVGRLSSLASLVTACRLCGTVDWALEKISPRIEPREDRSGPPRHEVERLVQHLEEAGDRFAVRDLAIVRLLHGAALRRNEVVSLRIMDAQLDHADGPRVMAKRKGKKEREAMLIGKLAANSLRDWLDVRGEVEPTAAVFCRIHAAPDNPQQLTGEAVRCMLRSRAKQAGLRAPCRPHGLRHSAASHCARHAPLAALKRLGGWTTLTSPSRYIDRDDRDRLTALNVVEV